MSFSSASAVSFMAAYSRVLADAVFAEHSDNYDWRRYGKEPAKSAGQALSGAVARFFKDRGLVRASSVKYLLDVGLQRIEPHLADLEWLWQHLEDAESRDLLVQVTAYRTLGPRHVKLPLNQPKHWNRVEEMERAAAGCETIDSGFKGWHLPKMDLRKIGFPIELFLRPSGVVTQFIHQQYRCVTPDGVIEAREGDVVIDGGGCWADTALYFAALAGERGKVFSFEFLPENLKIYRRNLELNPQLSKRIRLLPHPLWSESDQELFVNPNGPGTSVGPARSSPDALSVRTLHIDRLLERGDADRVDFIKMDIEGAELAALQGAESTLRRFRPRLAITVYHDFSDFWKIPKYLDSLGAGYQFYLRHFTIHAEETVLFAACPAAKNET